jgi:hypothetical protein
LCPKTPKSSLPSKIFRAIKGQPLLFELDPALQATLGSPLSSILVLSD